MNTNNEIASKTVELALKNAISRLSQIHGRDRISLSAEYKEWLENTRIDQDVWFSTNRNLN